MPPRQRSPRATNNQPDLLASPALFPRQFDFAQRVTLLVRMTRDTYRDSTFLDDRTKIADPRALTLPIPALAQRLARDARPNPPVWRDFLGQERSVPSRASRAEMQVG